MSNAALLATGRMLATLPGYWTSVTARKFARSAVNAAARHTSVEGLCAELSPHLINARGATNEQIDQVAAAVWEVVHHNGIDLTTARQIVGAIWSGVVITKRD